jgi:toxin CptA
MKAPLVRALAIQLTPPLLLLGLLGVISIISCIILWQLSAPLAVKLGCIGLVVSTTAYIMLRDALLQLPWSWKRLEMNNQGHFKLTNKRGQQFAPKLSSASFIHPTLIILNIERKGFKLGLPPIIYFNKPISDQHRQLRVRLRWMPDFLEEKGSIAKA